MLTRSVRELACGGVELNDEDKSALVIVPDNQLSLAIGQRGQNARLAAKLTGWKVDIKGESEATVSIDEIFKPVTGEENPDMTVEHPSDTSSEESDHDNAIAAESDTTGSEQLVGATENVEEDVDPDGLETEAAAALSENITVADSGEDTETEISDTPERDNES